MSRRSVIYCGGAGVFGVALAICGISCLTWQYWILAPLAVMWVFAVDESK